MDTIYTRTQIAAKCLRPQFPSLLNDTQDIIINKLYTHSIEGFSFFYQAVLWYTTQCQ